MPQSEPKFYLDLQCYCGRFPSIYLDLGNNQYECDTCGRTYRIIITVHMPKGDK
jgi:hypothetical protein